jgi:hypothetical protein
VAAGGFNSDGDPELTVSLFDSSGINLPLRRMIDVAEHYKNYCLYGLAPGFVVGSNCHRRIGDCFLVFFCSSPVLNKRY